MCGGTLAFSIEFMAIGIVIFFSGYFIGWYTRGKWEGKLKPLFIKERKEMKKAKIERKRNPRSVFRKKEDKKNARKRQ